MEGRVRLERGLRIELETAARPTREHLTNPMLTIPNFLSDHTVRGTAVLPGAHFLSSTLAEHGALADVRFLAMQLIDERATGLETRRENGVIELLEPGSDTVIASARPVDGATAATVEPHPVESIETLDGAALYARLAARGNDYGKRFRGLEQVHRGDGVGEATFVAPAALPADAAGTVAIDCCTHLVALIADLPATYVLAGVREVALLGSVESGARSRLRARLVESSPEGCVADCLIVSEAGRPLVRLAGVELRLLEARSEAPEEVLAVAANFTIDPLAEVTGFWATRLDRSLRAELADYDQLFQSLLSGEGAFSERAASHTALVRVADFDRKMTERAEAAAPLPDGLATYTLPDGREIASLNEYETAYLYQEIFRDLAYRRYDVRILDNDTVLDIGANIGLFSLFAASEAENVRSIAIEPSPVVLPILRANLARYAPRGIVVEGGASSGPGTARFTAYRHSSVFSSFEANEKADEEAIRQVIRNTLDAGGHTDEALIEQAVEELLAGRMEAEEYDCRLVSVSDVIREHGVTRIGLLKVDAEKSEDAILAGIDESHWAMIEQVIIEVHLQGGRSEDGVVAMLESHGFEVTRDEEALLSDSGLITLYAVRPERKRRNAVAMSDQRLADSASLLIDAARAHAERSARPLRIVLCPTDIRDPVVAEEIAATERRIAAELDGAPRMTVMWWRDFARHYPVDQIYDPEGDELAHIPYTNEWYAATGSALVRRHAAATRAPLKAIVLDCDNTLWRGVVGEDGAAGVRIDEGHRALCAFVKNRIASGMLLCLASKNVEADVRAVFEERADFGLSWSDVTAHRVNWSPKHENVAALAAELNLGLDAFVFLDDSPVECGEMRARRPEVLTLQLPGEAADFGPFLEHVWAFDEVRAATEEDRRRAQRYREERRRAKERRAASSIEDFVASLALEVRIEPGSEATLERMSQMSQRTNQFNLTTVRRDVDEMRETMGGERCCEIVTVSDRFGDYGITGLLIAEPESEALLVDTLLLSCRVLGRGVEHALLRRLGEIAAEHGLERIRLPFRRTARNEPVARFLEGIDGERLVHEDGFDLVLSAADAAAITYRPGADEEASEKAEEAGTETGESVAPAWAPSLSMQAVASELRTAAAVAAAAGSRERVSRPALETPYRAPESDAERSVCALWEEMLGIDGIGADDSYFELGGTSLSGVQMIAELRRRTKTAISVVELFATPTIAHLASKLGQEEGATAAAEGKRRGAERRAVRTRRARR